MNIYIRRSFVRVPHIYSSPPFSTTTTIKQQQQQQHSFIQVSLCKCGFSSSSSQSTAAFTRLQDACRARKPTPSHRSTRLRPLHTCTWTRARAENPISSEIAKRIAMSAPTTTRAIVAYPPDPNAPPGPNWKLEDNLKLSAVGDTEVLVEMVATGICHTDIVLTSVPPGALGIEYPKVAGHEGSGYVRAVGSKVTTVAVGDPVLLSFDFCRTCTPCSTTHPAYCDSFAPFNYNGQAERFTTAEGGTAWGKFFGQSSYANFSVCSEASVLNAKNLVRSEHELKLFAPLGCGLQTGSSAVLRTAAATPDDCIVIMGLGGVGMAAIMAAKVVGCKQIIALDRVQSRLDLAKEVGATHQIDTGKDMDIAAQVRKINKDGATIVLDTTGVPVVIEAGYKALGRRGKLVLIGVTPMEYELKVPTIDAINNGTTVMGCILGDSTPSHAIPQMIEWYRNGQFPFDRLVKIMPLEDFGKALHEMHDGSCIKPILTF